jgi:predicted naringenin-chalcone synthase
MGCYGAFNGLKVADAIVRADTDARVLLLSVELCTLHFQNKTEEDHLLANALFADGAAAVLIEGAPSPSGYSLELVQFACELLPEGAEDMAWHISDHGFEMKLTSRVPEVLREGLPALLDTLLDARHLSIDQLTHLLVHPGGRRILEVVSQALGLSPTAHRWAYEVLRDYGNMSSATILFVLQKLLQSTDSTEGAWGVACAFGPGLTAETLLFRVKGGNRG